ncbi:hypothetical protein SPM24T3_13895 [Serratia sp. M24T3]|nr:hypothetical protein SPM24T3_13895 [Serratia sp. M24T3]
MTASAWLSLTPWLVVLFIWMPWRFALHQQRINEYRKLVRAHRFYKKYKVIKALNGHLKNEYLRRL